MQVGKKSSSQSRSVGITRVMSFTSGKGGVGKTNTVVNVGIALARMGRSVLLLDADLGLASVDVMLGITPRYNLYDVLCGEKSLEEITISGPDGISIIPAASGVEEVCNLNSDQRLMLMHAVEQAAASYDYLLIDTQAGIGPDVMCFNSASNEIVCVINGEPTSLTDAYAMIKLLAQNYGEKEFSIIANNVPGEKAAEKAFNQLRRSVDRFLHVSLKYIGFVPSDSAVREAIQTQKAVLEIFPSSPAGLALASNARKIDLEFNSLRVKGGMQFFFRQLLEMTDNGYGRC